MKKYLALAAACLLLFSAGCGAQETAIISETTTSLEQMNSVDLEQIAPKNIDITVPVSYPATADDIDASGGTEVYAADAYNPDIADTLGADQIIECKDYDIYYFTSTDVPVTFLDIPTENDEFLLYYLNGVLNRITSTAYTWYFTDGALDYVVVIHSSESGGFCSFYDTAGNKIFYRIGNDYYSPDSDILETSEVTALQEHYGNAYEFSVSES